MKSKNLLPRLAPLCLTLALLPLALHVQAAEVSPAPMYAAHTVSTDTREIVLLPRWAHLTRVAASLSISDDGYAKCGGQYTNYDGYGGTLTIVLQQERDGKWYDIKEWSTDFDTDGAKMYTKGWYVKSGYRYRVVATAELVDGGEVIESGTCDSPIYSY